MPAAARTATNWSATFCAMARSLSSYSPHRDGSGECSNVLQVQHGRGLGANAPLQYGVVNQRFAVGGDDLLELWKPTVRGQLVLEAFLQHADRDERRS